MVTASSSSRSPVEGDALRKPDCLETLSAVAVARSVLMEELELVQAFGLNPLFAPSRPACGLSYSLPLENLEAEMLGIRLGTCCKPNSHSTWLSRCVSV